MNFQPKLRWSSQETRRGLVYLWVCLAQWYADWRCSHGKLILIVKLNRLQQGRPCIIQKATINAKNRHKKEDFFDRWLQPISRHPSVREPVHFSHHPVKMQPPRNLVRFVINLSRPVCGSPGATLTYPVCIICVCLIENGNSDPTEGHFYSRNQDRI